MRLLSGSLAVLMGASLLAGCVVRAYPPRRAVVYVGPPAPVEVVPVSPGPDFIWVGGYRDYWGWHRGYWRHR